MNKKERRILSISLSVLISIFLVSISVFAVTTIGERLIIGSNGTVGSPAVQFANDSDTGLYLIGADNLGIAVLATRAFSIIGNANGPNIIGGHSQNNITGSYSSTIAGGGLDGFPNTITDSVWSFIGGGEDNRASNSQGITIGGGEHNEVDSGRSTIVGGAYNGIHGTTGYAFIGGGLANQILTTSDHPTNNLSFIGGGQGNIVYEDVGAILGGYYNQSIGHYSVVLGGEHNIAGANNSLAAGRKASASHQGSFVWADSTDAYFESELNDEIAFRAGGGLRLVVAGSNDLFRIFDDTDEIFTILDGGNVGINDVAPGYELSLDGTASISDTLYLGNAGISLTTGTASPSGNCTVGSIHFNSSANSGTGANRIISVCDVTNEWSAVDVQ